MRMHKRMVKLAEEEGVNLPDIRRALAEVRMDYYSGGVSQMHFPVSTRVINSVIRTSADKIRERPWFTEQDVSSYSDKEKEHHVALVERLKLDAETDMKNLIKQRKVAKVGDTLVIHSFNEVSDITQKFSVTYKLMDPDWCMVECWNELDEKTPMERLFFPGIRQDVASKLGVPITDNFHELFVWVASGYNESEYFSQMCRHL